MAELGTFQGPGVMGAFLLLLLLLLVPLVPLQPGSRTLLLLPLGPARGSLRPTSSVEP